MIGDVTSPLIPQFFLIGYRRFTKMTIVRSGGLFSPVPPVATPLQLV